MKRTKHHHRPPTNACNKSREENTAHALKKLMKLLQRCADRCCQALFQSHYCQIKNDKTAFDDADQINGLTSRGTVRCRQKNKIVLVGGSILKATDGNFYNTSIILAPMEKQSARTVKCIFPKIFCITSNITLRRAYGGYDVFDTPFGKSRVLICYDQWFPKPLAFGTQRC